MISTFRTYLGTWAVRGFFFLLVIAFATWGIGDVVRNVGGSGTWVAKVGDRTIEPPELDQAYRRDMADVTRRLQNQDPSPEIKRAVARQALDRLITQGALTDEARRLRLAVPDEALRQAIYDMPAFKDPAGTFDRSRFDAVLRNNGLNEPRFLDVLRTELSQRQLLEAVRAGVAAPSVLTTQAFAGQTEQRVADVALFPITNTPPVPVPDEATLQRWYDNHPDLYRSPEFRRIEAIVLSPEVVGEDIPVGTDELQAEFDRTKDSFAKPARRTVEVVMAPNEDKARALAAEWKAGATWDAMQQKARDAGASAIALPDAIEAAFPSPELGKAAFAAAVNTVSDPAQSPLGWFVLRVTEADPGMVPDFEALKPQLRERVQAEKSADLIYDRANKIDNILSSGSTLEELPGDLGVKAIAGTLDAAGNTLDGQPAPIPGNKAIRDAIVAAAFTLHKGDPPHLTEVPLPGGGSGYYALTVSDITPAATKPFAEVRDKVLADVTRDLQRHRAEQQAAGMLSAIKGGRTFASAAAQADVTVLRTTPFARNAPPPSGVDPEIAQQIFTLKKGEPGMAETANGFVVFTPVEITSGVPKSDPTGYAKLQDSLTRGYGDDFELAFANALRQRAGVRVNDTVLNNFTQP